MKRKTLFQRLLLIILLACLLTAGLSGMIYSVTGARMMANRIAMEMMPWANGISRLGARYYRGQLSLESFLDLAVREQRGGEIYIFDGQGNILAYTDSANAEASLRYISGFTQEVLDTGKSVTSIKWRSPAGILVGTPILGWNGKINGIVFISKPRSDVQQIMGSMTLSLGVSCILVLLALIPLAYLFSKKFTAPIRQMTNVALSMSGGDFTKKADQGDIYELYLLGGALNQLSGALDTTIGELKDAKERLHTILEGLGEGVIALDQGEISYFNPAAANLLGCAKETQAIQNCLLCCDTPIETALQSGETSSMVVEKGDRILRITASLCGDQPGKEKNVVLLLQDISEFERLERTRRDYVANVSHELRTPIASIRSLAETLNDGMIQNEDTKNRYYGYILRESMRLSRLINDLLELSRLQSGRLPMEKEVFDLRQLLTEVVERTSITASYSGIDLEYRPIPLPQVFSNRDRVEQVLVALLDNAIKYSEDEGRVAISTEVMDNQILVQIRNTGAIDEKDLPHIFERFYKADIAHSGEGTGLGLAIVYEVLSGLNEKITAFNSEGDAVMEFTLTLAEEKFTK